MKTMITLTASLLVATSTWAISPQTGTWVVTDEVNGEPGRGIALDVQGNTLVMQVFAYKPDGSSAFYLSSGELSEDNQYEASLNEYQGGRYFGSDARIGSEVGSVGNVKLRFLNGMSGFIQFPNEPERAIQRYQFKYSENPESLLGYWVTTTTNPEDMTTTGGYFDLTHIIQDGSSVGNLGGVSNASHTTSCAFIDYAENYVMCSDRIGNIIMRAYAFKLSVNEGFGITYPTTRFGTQLGGGQIFTIKRLLTSDGQMVGLGDGFSDVPRPTQSKAIDLPVDYDEAIFSDAFKLIAAEMQANGVFDNKSNR